MWIVIFALMLICGIGGLVYLLTRFRKFAFMKKLSGGKKFLSWFLAAVPLLMIGCFWFINMFALIVVLIHLALFWLIADLIGLAVRRVRKKESRLYIPGAAAILFTAVYLGFGWYLAHHVFRTDYSFTTEKSLGQDSLRVVEIADLHLGITLDGDQFAEEMKRVEEESPDIVIIAGDFVDDDSQKADMIKACAALDIKTTYGVYFVYGNHDKGYYSYRDFDSEQLDAELVKNNVTILRDETVLVNDSFYITGRRDKSEGEREDMASLSRGLDPSKYHIVIDHQPNSYSEEAESGADLVLSGHTHGGHIWPAGQIGLLIGANDRIYGTEVREDTTFVVTSGISGCAIPFKTGTKSEYVVIDIKEKKAS